MALQVRHAELLAEVCWAIHAVSPSPDERNDIEADHDLVEDLSMDGRQILQALELLEEATGLTLSPSVAINLVIQGPTVGRLTRLLAQMKEDARHAG